MMAEQEIVVDLSTYGVRVFAGRPNGEKAREKYEIDELDREYEKIVVRIPDDTRTLTSSFILGLLGKEIVASGGKSKFLEKYDFRLPEKHRKNLDMAISRALFNSKIGGRLV